MENEMTTNYWVLDIETIGKEVSAMPKLSREYVTAKVEAKRKDQGDYGKYCALNPFFGQIIAIGYYNSSTNGYYCEVSGNEKVLLEFFWKLVETNKNNTIVTYNGKNFDIPFIKIRSSLLGIAPAANKMASKRFDTLGHFDCYEVLSNFQSMSSAPTLSVTAELYGLDVDEFDGSHVKGWWDKKEFEAIKEYCIGDVRKTKELYEKIRGYW